MRIGQAHRLHRPVTQRFAAAFGHDLDRQAAIEIRRAFPFLEAGLVARDQRIDESIVLRLVHRAVDIVLARTARSDLVVTGLEPADIHVDAFGVDDRRDGIEEGERIGPGFRLDRTGKRRRRQRAGGNDREIPVFRRQSADFLARHGNQRMAANGRRHGIGEPVTIDSKRAAGRNLVLVGAGHDQRTGKPHLGMQHANRIAGGVIGAEGVGADQFGQAVGLVGIRAAHAAHLVKDDRNAGFSDLPGGFGAGKAAADNMDGGVGRCICHAPFLRARRAGRKPVPCG